MATMGIHGGSDVFDNGHGSVVLRLIERSTWLLARGENLGHGHGDLGLTKEQTKFDEGPWSMVLPLLAAACIVLVIGIYNQDAVNQIERFLEPFNLPKGTGRP